MDQLQQIKLDQAESIPVEARVMEEKHMADSSQVKSSAKLIIIVLAVILGVGTGWKIAKNSLLIAKDSSPSPMSQNPTDAGSVKVGDTFGTADEKTFRDNVEGVIQAGGIGGEGSHHLERGADKSQWVYLTSSVVDLDNFISHKVTVWGETFQGKKAGWLMDVGKLKVVELNAAPATVNQVEE